MEDKNVLNSPTLIELLEIDVHLWYERTAIIYNDGQSTCVQTYKELSSISQKIRNVLLMEMVRGTTVGLCLSTNLYTPAIICGILKSDAAFYSFNKGSIKFVMETLRNINCNVLLVHSQFLQDMSELIAKFEGTLVKDDYLATLDIVLIRIKTGCHLSPLKDVAYCITTSGSTGQPKIVWVPHTCIVPNITHLREVYNMSCQDLVLLCSPLTFDPSIVEIFVTLTSGACLLIVPNQIKLQPVKLLSLVHNKFHVTLMQATPSLIQRFDCEDLRESIFGDNSHLRILALGGEEFPSLNVRRNWRTTNNQTKFINLYGITEVSCWAFVYSLTQKGFWNEGFVPLGQPLSDTRYKVLGEDGKEVKLGFGRLYVGGSLRACFINNEDETGRISDTYRDTGDIVEVREDGHFVYIRRRDRQIKRNGCRLNLDEIEKVVTSLIPVTDCRSVVSGNQLLVFFVPQNADADLSENIQQQLEERLPRHYSPDRVIELAKIPLTKHGKCDYKWLQQYTSQLNSSHSTSASLRCIIQEQWKRCLGCNIVRERDNFIFCGGDSLSAVQLVNNIERRTGLSAPGLIDIILQKSYADIMSYLCTKTSSEIPRKNSPVKKQTASFEIPNKRIKKHHHNKSIELSRRDENYDNSVTSKYLQYTKKFVRDKHHNKVPIEYLYSIMRGNNYCKAYSISSYGAHSDEKINHSLGYPFNIIPHHSTSHNDSDVKSICDGNKSGDDKDHCNIMLPLNLPCEIKHNTSILTSHQEPLYPENQTHVRTERPHSDISHKAYKNDMKPQNQNISHQRSKGDIKLMWKYDTRKCVDASPLVVCFSPQKHVVYIGSHSHNMYAIVMETGDLLWETTLGDRIESSACLSHCGRYVIVGCYDGGVYFLSSDCGDIYWTFYTQSAVKCSPVVDLGTDLVIVGSHDHHVYALNIERKCCEWQSDVMRGSIFSSPVVSTHPHYVCVCSLSGVVAGFDVISGNTLWQYNVRKPVFSSPSLTNIGPCVGCVDGNLYQFDHHGNMIWKFLTKAPIFSSPTVYQLHDILHILIGSHDSHVYCINCDGDQIWQYKMADYVYASCFCFCFPPDKNESAPRESKLMASQHSQEHKEINSSTELKSQRNINKDCVPKGSNCEHEETDNLLCDGCCECPLTHDCDSKEDNYRQEKTKYPMYDRFSQTPDPRCVVVSKDGTLTVLKMESGQLVNSVCLQGEVFSSPVVVDKFVLVGCRDNFVYCYKL